MQNCRFLQRGRDPEDRAEDESIARLTEALREAKPLKVAITNWRKDGTAFRNLLAIKPIMDQNGDYVSNSSSFGDFSFLASTFCTQYFIFLIRSCKIFLLVIFQKKISFFFIIIFTGFCVRYSI